MFWYIPDPIDSRIDKWHSYICPSNHLMDYVVNVSCFLSLALHFVNRHEDKGSICILLHTFVPAAGHSLYLWATPADEESSFTRGHWWWGLRGCGGGRKIGVVGKWGKVSAMGVNVKISFGQRLRNDSDRGNSFKPCTNTRLLVSNVNLLSCHWFSYQNIILFILPSFITSLGKK